VNSSAKHMSGAVLGCFSDFDCPNTGYRCYNAILRNKSPGICHCMSTLAIYGDICQYSATYSKVLNCLYAFTSFIGLLITANMLISKIRTSAVHFDAFTTTLFQNMLAFLTETGTYMIFVYRSFYPSNHRFWTLKLLSYVGSAAYIHGLGSAFNISLLWIEISISGRREFWILKNIKKTKHIFLVVLCSLYTVYAVIYSAFFNFRLGQVVFDVYVAFLLLSFWFGAKMLSKLVCSRDCGLVGKSTQEQFNRQINHLQLIASSANSVLFFGTLFLLLQIAYLLTYKLRVCSVSYFLYLSCKCSFMCINFTVFSYLSGQHFTVWGFFRYLISKGHKRQQVSCDCEELK